jgi:putative phosphotransacetylase
MRHVHLSQNDLETLFGRGAKYVVVKNLSQPGQFLAEQRVDLIGVKKNFDGVGIIGPTRAKSQVEISRTDAFMLGLKNVPIRQSGQTDGAPTISVRVGDKQIDAAVIIAKRHVHLTPETAKKYGIADGQNVKIKFCGERGAILDMCVARVDKTYADAVHIDSDESNAVLAQNECEILL